MTLTKKEAQAYRHLIAEQERVGSNCVDRPHEFSGGRPVSREEAQKLCFGCLLSGEGNACRAYLNVAISASGAYGVYDGEWVDTHGDVEVGWEEEVQMVLEMGSEDTELLITTERSGE